MEPMQSENSKNSSNISCKESVNSLGACYLENTLSKGRSVEIPSLGIVITRKSHTEVSCKTKE